MRRIACGSQSGVVSLLRRETPRQLRGNFPSQPNVNLWCTPVCFLVRSADNNPRLR